MMSVDKNKYDDIGYRLAVYALLFAYALALGGIILGIGFKLKIPYLVLFFFYCALCASYYFLTSPRVASVFERIFSVKLGIGFVRLFVYVVYSIIIAISVFLKLKNMYNNTPFTTQSIMIDTVFVPALVTCISIDRVRDLIKKKSNTNS